MKSLFDSVQLGSLVFKNQVPISFLRLRESFTWRLSFLSRELNQGPFCLGTSEEMRVQR
jgi:hypothetical protein